jgi:DNA replication protein DnaC
MTSASNRYVYPSTRTRTTASPSTTSNLDFTEWDQAFAANRLLAWATLDRLRHNAYCLELDGRSYRDPKASQAPKVRRVRPRPTAEA